MTDLNLKHKQLLHDLPGAERIRRSANLYQEFFELYASQAQRGGDYSEAEVRIEVAKRLHRTSLETMQLLEKASS